MKKILKIVSVVTAIVGTISAVWLMCLYMGDIVGYVEAAKNNISKIIARKNH